MKNILLKLITFILLFGYSIPAMSLSEVKINEIQVLGRAVVSNNNIIKARKLALEDALYLAALKGGAIVEGFSSISKSTILNDQSIIKPTSKVLDFKILEEKQIGEHLEIKILAIVGLNKAKTECKPKPLNITVFRGKKIVDHNLPSKVLRSIHVWYEDFYKIIKAEKQINLVDKSHVDFEDVRESSINSDYDYNAIVNGLPNIKQGNFSLNPRFEISTLDLEYNFQNPEKTASYKVILDFYKGPDYKFHKQIIIEQQIPYEYSSKFQLIKSTFSRSIDDINNMVKIKTIEKLNEIVDSFNCSPLQGVLRVNNKKELLVDLGFNQGLFNRQIGIVKSNYNSSFMKRSDNVVLYVTEIQDNFSKLVPLNDEVEILNLNNQKIQFVE